MINSLRTRRLSARLLREAAYFDVETKQKHTFMNRNKLLEKYEGRPDVFVSFTSLPKLGVNPKSEYNTPMGIYSYPVDFVIKSFSGGKFKVPYMAEQGYIHVFRFTNISGCLIFEEGAYDLVMETDIGAGLDADRDKQLLEESGVLPVLQEIKEFVAKTVPPPVIMDKWELAAEDEEEVMDWYDEWIYELSNETGLNSLEDEELRKLVIQQGWLGVDSVVETFHNQTGFRIIPAKYAVTDYLRKKDKVAPAFPYEDRLWQLSEVKAMSEGEYVKFKFKVLGENVVCDTAYVWNATRHLSKGNPRKWTGLMRQMGLLGAIDHGTGTIHPNEPDQALFFDPSSIKILDVLPNTNPYAREESTHLGMMSEWASKDEKRAEGVKESIQSLVSDTSYKIKRADFAISLWHWNSLQRQIGWMNMHAQNSPNWSPEIKNELARELEECKEIVDKFKVEIPWYNKLSNILGLTLKMLRR